MKELLGLTQSIKLLIRGEDRIAHQILCIVGITHYGQRIAIKPVMNRLQRLEKLCVPRVRHSISD